MRNDKKVILASASPRRLDIMKEHGINPRVMPAYIEENDPHLGGPADAVIFLSFKKALSVAESLWANGETEGIIVASDTIVYKDKIIGKPTDKREAEETLLSLSGNCHQVYSGVCLIDLETGRKRGFADCSDVYFKTFTASDISDYLDTAEPYDKAGGYAIQGTFGQFIDRYEGSLLNIIGFPWERFSEEIDNL